MPAEPMLTHSAEVAPIPVLPGISRRTLSWGERTLLAEFSMANGSAIPPHSHPHEQTGYVARGRLDFTVGSARAVLAAGDAYAIPGGVVHAVIALEDSVAVDVFSPVREEYRPGNSVA